MEGSPQPGSVEIELGIADAASGDGESLGDGEACHDEAAGEEESGSRGLSDPDSQDDARNERAQRGEQQGSEGGEIRLPGEGKETGNHENSEGSVKRALGFGAGRFRTHRWRRLWRGSGRFHAEDFSESIRKWFSGQLRSEGIIKVPPAPGWEGMWTAPWPAAWDKGKGIPSFRRS